MSSLLWACTVTIAFGHEELVATSPASGETILTSPTEIRLSFDGPIRDGSTFTIFDQSFKQFPVQVLIDPAHPTDMVAPEPALPAGSVYTVQWLVISQDEHAVTGSYNFAIGDDEMLLIATAAEATAFNPPGWVAWLMVFLAIGVPLLFWSWATRR